MATAEVDTHAVQATGSRCSAVRCAKVLPRPVRFCPYCGTEQTPSAPKLQPTPAVAPTQQTTGPQQPPPANPAPPAPQTPTPAPVISGPVPPATPTIAPSITGPKIVGPNVAAPKIAGPSVTDPVVKAPSIKPPTIKAPVRTAPAPNRGTITPKAQVPTPGKPPSRGKLYGFLALLAVGGVAWYIMSPHPPKTVDVHATSEAWTKVDLSDFQAGTVLNISGSAPFRIRTVDTGPILVRARNGSARIDRISRKGVEIKAISDKPVQVRISAAKQ